MDTYMNRTGILGGTFDVIHDGHQAVLSTAFREGDHIIVGVTADQIANTTRERTVKQFENRSKNIQELCKTYQNIFNATFEITKISDPKTVAIESDADFIVLSPEHKTHERAAEINYERVKQKKDRLQIIEAPLVEDHKDRKISSTRIVNNEIDNHGNPI